MLRRATKSGAFSRVSYRKGKRNESCKQEDAGDAKKNNFPLHVLLYFAVRAVSKGPVQKFILWNLPWSCGIIRKTTQDEAAEQWVSSCICSTIMRKIAVFGERRVLCKMPRQPLLGNFIFSHIHVVLCITLKAHTILKLHKPKSTQLNDYESIIQDTNLRQRKTCSLLQTTQGQSIL